MAGSNSYKLNTSCNGHYTRVFTLLSYLQAKQHIPAETTTMMMMMMMMRMIIMIAALAQWECTDHEQLH